MNKYYFITYINKRLGRQFLDSNVINEHPFNWLKHVQSDFNKRTVLIGWREISEEEYNMFDKDEIDVRSDQTKTPKPNPVTPMDFGSPDPDGLEG